MKSREASKKKRKGVGRIQRAEGGKEPQCRGCSRQAASALQHPFFSVKDARLCLSCLPSTKNKSDEHVRGFPSFFFSQKLPQHRCITLASSYLALVLTFCMFRFFFPFTLYTVKAS